MDDILILGDSEFKKKEDKELKKVNLSIKLIKTLLYNILLVFNRYIL